MGKWDKEKEIVLAAARGISEKGLVTGTAGNVSLRLAPEGNLHLLAVTPSCRPYGSLSIDDIQVIDFSGNAVIDRADLTLFRPHLFTSAGGGGYDFAFDLNGDGVIDRWDYLILRRRRGVSP